MNACPSVCWRQTTGKPGGLSILLFSAPAEAPDMHDANRGLPKFDSKHQAQRRKEHDPMTAGTRFAVVLWIVLEDPIDRLGGDVDGCELAGVGPHPRLGQLIQRGLHPCDVEHQRFSR
jgi:hypothetical protein